MPATVETLRVYLGIGGARDVDTEAMQYAVDAANRVVAVFRPDVAGETEWPAEIESGALIQAARLYGRRGSVQGIAAFQDIGAVTLGRLDPDVRLLLGLGEYQPSVIA